MTKKHIMVWCVAVCLGLAASRAIHNPGTAEAASGPGEEGLVAYYPFDEGAGAVLHDRSGNGNDGKILGAKWGKAGSDFALEFDGVDDYVDFGAPKGLDITGPVTLEAWINPHEMQLARAEPGVVGKYFANYVMTYYQFNNSCYWYVGSGGNHVKYLVNPGKWNHVVAVFDGKALGLYVDGELRARKWSKYDKISPGRKFMMGRCDWGDASHADAEYTKGAHFRGSIAQVRVYDRVLTPAEVARHYVSAFRTNVVEIAVTKVPWRKRMLVLLDARGLAEFPADVQVHVRLLKAGRELPGFSRKIALRSRFAKPLITLSTERLDPGEYALEARARSSSGAPIGRLNQVEVTWPATASFPRGKAGARKLNNLVTELLNVSDRTVDKGPVRYEFTNPRKGCVFVSCTAGIHGDGSVRVSLDSDPELKDVIVVKPGATGSGETMRLLDAGKHELAVRCDGRQTIGRLIVRAIPELGYATFKYDPRAEGFPPWRMDFLQRAIFRNVNCMTSGRSLSAHQEFIKNWKRQGRRWIDMCGVPAALTVETAYKYIVNHRGFRDPLIDGVIANEFTGGRRKYYSSYAGALRQIHQDPAFAGKTYYAYTSLYDNDEARALRKALIDCGDIIAWEVYLKEQPDEAAVWRHFDGRLVRRMLAARNHAPDIVHHLLMAVGYMSAPPESLDTNPGVNFRVFMDMYFNFLANHPAFDGLYGIMPYQCNYVDEEMARWTSRLMRHYGIEGRTEMFSNEPYRLDYLRNPDFARGTEGWTLSPAEKGSIAVRNVLEYGWLQGRYPRSSEGDTALMMRRCAKRPNAFSQTIENLQPGKVYSLRMYTCDARDTSVKQVHAVSVKLDGADWVPRKSLSFAYKACHAAMRKWASKGKADWLNYHWRLFRAKDTTAKLTISDWAGRTKPGGPVGQELLYNFVQIQPYFEEDTVEETVLAPESTELTANWWKVGGKQCIAAYRGIGVKSLDASYVNLAQPAKYSLKVGGIAPAWWAHVGWAFNAADAGYLDTGIVLPEGCTVAVRIANGRLVGMPVGTHSRGGGDLQIEPLKGCIYWRYGNKTLSERMAFSDGVLALSGPQAYRDGKKCVDTKGDWPKKGKGIPLFIGARNNVEKKGADCFFTGDVLAVAIYADTLTEHEIAALSKRMNALTVPR